MYYLKTLCGVYTSTLHATWGLASYLMSSLGKTVILTRHTSIIQNNPDVRDGHQIVQWKVQRRSIKGGLAYVHRKI